MAILIDGYNLLHVTGIFGRGVGPGTLHRARRALLNVLAGALDDQERAATTVVFDAVDAPPGLAAQVQCAGIQVRYAVGYESADEMLEELIRLDFAPRSLTVVSSDRQVQRAARRRRAKVVASHVWFASLQSRKQAAADHAPPPSTKPATPLSPEEVAFWLRQFSQSPEALPKVLPSQMERLAGDDSEDEEPDSDLWNPFPPGYAEDLWDQDP